MGRAKNMEKRRFVEACAFQLFMEVGYQNASYARIAERSGLTKSAVQALFPQKEQLAVSFIHHLERNSEEYLEQQGLLSDNAFANLYLIGQVHFIFLTRCTRAKAFFFDLLSSRALTSSVVAFDNRFALDYIGKTSATEHEDLYEDLVISMGGMYELMYHRMSHNRPIDVSKAARQLVSALFVSLGVSVDEEIFAQHDIPERDYDGINEWLMQRFGIE